MHQIKGFIFKKGDAAPALIQNIIGEKLGIIKPDAPAPVASVAAPVKVEAKPAKKESKKKK